MSFFHQTAPIAGIAWGMHEAFREYIGRMSDGEISVQDGAELLDTGEAFFPVDAQLTAHEEVRFTGSLQFTGHHGMLAVRIQHPWLEQTSDATALTITDPFEPSLRMPLVTVVLQQDGIGSTRLTEEGADVFLGNYRTNTDFDPIRIVWVEKD